MLALFATLYACATETTAPPAVPAAAPAAAPVWPAAGAPLAILSPEFGEGPPKRVLIDAGHGAVDNPGNTGVRCQREMDVTKRLQDEVLARFASWPAIAASGTRPDDAPVDYDTRIARADTTADVMISLHTDARAGTTQTLHPVTGCRATTGAAGFAVLWSDEGAPAVARRSWAVAIARRLREAGFLAYSGADYTGLYEGDPENPGVFVDRHVPGQRIKILRRTTTATVIVEAHQALDADEVDRWDEPLTLDAFAAALAAAIADVRS